MNGVLLSITEWKFYQSSVNLLI